MKILLTKGVERNRLHCYRSDNSSVSADLGPDLPYHDLAHYVIESYFSLNDGFFGKIDQGMSIAELSSGEVIRTLGPQTWLAEVMARNLQGLGSGACTAQQYIELLEWEARLMSIPAPKITSYDVSEMICRYNGLCRQWEQLEEQESLALIFSTD